MKSCFRCFLAVTAYNYHCLMKIIIKKNVNIPLLKECKKVYEYNNAMEYDLYTKQLTEKEFKFLKKEIIFYL